MDGDPVVITSNILLYLYLYITWQYALLSRHGSKLARPVIIHDIIDGLIYMCQVLYIVYFIRHSKEYSMFLGHRHRPRQLAQVYLAVHGLYIIFIPVYGGRYLYITWQYALLSRHGSKLARPVIIHDIIDGLIYMCQVLYIVYFIRHSKEYSMFLGHRHRPRQLAQVYLAVHGLYIIFIPVYGGRYLYITWQYALLSRHGSKLARPVIIHDIIDGLIYMCQVLYIVYFIRHSKEYSMFLGHRHRPRQLAQVYLAVHGLYIIFIPVYGGRGADKKGREQTNPGITGKRIINVIGKSAI